MTSTTVTLPVWLVDALKAVAHNWAIFAVAIVSGIVVGFVAEFVKHRYTLAKAKQLALSKVHLVLGLLAGLMTGLQYYIPILQQHLRSLETLPYIGSYVVAIYAAAVFLYSVKTKGWYQKVFNTAQKLDAKIDPVLEPVQTQPNLPETDQPFVGE